MQAAAAYLNSQELINAKALINKKTRNGTDYGAVAKDPELYNAIQAVLNHLETTTTGIQVGVYSDGIICNSLKIVVNKQVEVHIKGQRPTGVLVANTQLFSSTEFPSLSAAYERWSKQQACPQI